DLLDVLAPEAAAARADLVSQGHGPAVDGHLPLRNLNPEELAVNALATDLDLQIVLDTPSPHERATTTRWTQRGIPHTIVPASGPHGQRYARFLHERLDRALAGGVRRPPMFSYRSASPAFSVWGWRVTSAEAPQGFRHLLSARTDGTGAILAGTGQVQVETPAAFVPGSVHRVFVAAGTRQLPPEPPIVHEVTADQNGRLHVAVDLGSIPSLEERAALTDALAVPTTRIWVLDRDPVPPSPGEQAPDERPLFDLDLPAPFDGWNVTVTAAARPGAYDLAFDSPVLDRRVNLYVWLPDAYTDAADPTPVAYFLHGTGLGRGHVDALRIDRHLARQSYVVVAPDTQDPLWCRSCWWVDARDDEYAVTYEELRQAGFEACEPLGICATDKPRVAAETHLYEEVITLTEAVLHVRTDRGGRAVFGHSMGASAAAHHGVRHPDRWAFAGALSGFLDTGADKEPVGDMWASYLSHQGYPPDPLAGPRLRNLSAVDLAPQTVGTGLDVTVTAGDGCLRDEPNCEPPSQANSGFFTELYVRQENDRSTPSMTELGLGHVYHAYEGTHFQGPQGLPLPVVYDTIYVDDLNRMFARNLVDPIRFSHKFIEREFSIWGYEFTVDRPNEEFLNVIAARLDGRDLRVAGTGTVGIVTPPAFEPHDAYVVEVTPAGRQPEVRTITADELGRLHLSVVLGAPRSVDETEAAIAAGAWDLPHTRIEVRTP
ncbi:MAG TPA: alpha/beta hydrolase-fold protein, partial [Nitriliruptorales bacterium]